MWTPKDIISLVVITGGMILLGLGRDSYVAWTTMGVVGSYYGIVSVPTVKQYFKKSEEKECNETWKQGQRD